MVNFIVSLTGQRGVQTFGQISFGVCLWGCFWVRLTFQSVDWVKQIALLKRWVDITQSIEDLNRTKGLNKRELFLFDSFHWYIGLFWPSDSDWNMSTLGSQASQLSDWNIHHWCSWFLGFQTWTDTAHQLSWVPSSLTADLGLLSLHSCTSQFLIIHIGSASLENWNIEAIPTKILSSCWSEKATHKQVNRVEWSEMDN